MKCSLSSLALCLTLIMQPALAGIDEDCHQILNDAQKVYPDLLPTDPPTQFSGPWCFRSYPNNFHAGINRLDADVYVLGAHFGNTPTFVGSTQQMLDTLSNELASIVDRGKNICDSGNSDLTGLFQSIEKNIIRISTKGACIQLPANKSFCEMLPVTDENNIPIETGNHILFETTIANTDFTGHNIPSIPGIPGLPSIPSIPNPLDLIAKSLETNVCIIDGPIESTDFDIKTDICLDLTDIIGDFKGLLGPVTMKFDGISSSRIVNDCFQSDADSITNLATQQAWIKNENGGYTLID